MSIEADTGHEIERDHDDYKTIAELIADVNRAFSLN